MDFDDLPSAVPYLVTISLLPIGFWVALLLLVCGVVWACGQLRSGLGLPVIVLMATIGSWYFIDAFYNNYVVYAVQFPPEQRSQAWWQVALFLLVFLLLAPGAHRMINARYLHRSSQVLRLVRDGADEQQLQMGFNRMFWGCFAVWIALSIAATCRLQGEVLYFFCPYLRSLADPWERERIGAGYDALYTLANYLELFVSMIFGVILALAKDVKIRLLAFICIFLAWPYYIFDGVRNTLLAITLPAILAWSLVRLRFHLVWKGLVLLFFFSVINLWFGFIISNRADSTIMNAFLSGGLDANKASSAHHEGLNMFEELCWVNNFIDGGDWHLQWGRGYFSEIVNPIPRTLWPDKPTIGIDYAIMRGQGMDDGQAGVGATLSTGMIGQGVLDFGQILGPAFAAFLMSIWVSILARLDLTGMKLGRLPLYGLGLILTFNLGRDITLLTLYTFIFGFGIIWLLEYRNKSPGNQSKIRPTSTPARERALPAPVEASPRPLLHSGFPPQAHRASYTPFPPRQN